MRRDRSPGLVARSNDAQAVFAALGLASRVNPQGQTACADLAICKAQRKS